MPIYGDAKPTHNSQSLSFKKQHCGTDHCKGGWGMGVLRESEVLSLVATSWSAMTYCFSAITCLQVDYRTCKACWDVYSEAPWLDALSLAICL